MFLECLPLLIKTSAIIEYSRPSGLTIEMYFLTVLEAGKSKIKLPARLASGETFPACRWPPLTGFSLCTHVPGVSSSSYKDVSPIGLGPYLMTSVSLNYFIKGPISKYSTLEVRASTYGLGEGYNSVHNTG